jgi:hypothetical protein
MRTQVIAVVLLLVFAPGISAQSPSPLAGSWRSAPEEIRLSSEFDRSVWGPNASSVRTVALVIRGSGQGALTITRKVVDGRGRTVAASTSIEEAQIQIGQPQQTIAGRVEHDVKLLKAERRYPDDPSYRWPLDGLRIKVTTFDDGDTNVLELRFDPADGRGAFWETLRRAGRSAPSRSTS